MMLDDDSLQEIECMKDVDRAAAIRGMTIRFVWTEGPTKGTQYVATRVADEIYAVSYLASSGYTLTVVLNFGDQQLVGFVSGAKEWYRCEAPSRW